MTNAQGLFEFKFSAISNRQKEQVLMNRAGLKLTRQEEEKNNDGFDAEVTAVGANPVETQNCAQNQEDQHQAHQSFCGLDKVWGS